MASLAHNSGHPQTQIPVTGREAEIQPRSYSSSRHVPKNPLPWLSLTYIHYLTPLAEFFSCSFTCVRELDPGLGVRQRVSWQECLESGRSQWIVRKWTCVFHRYAQEVGRAEIAMTVFE